MPHCETEWMPRLASLGSTEWWRSNRNERPEIVRWECFGRADPKSSSAQGSVQKKDANVGHQVFYAFHLTELLSLESPANQRHLPLTLSFE